MCIRDSSELVEGPMVARRIISGGTIAMDEIPSVIDLVLDGIAAT